MQETERPAGFDAVERVVQEPLRFKTKLAIGEKAYKSLMAGRLAADLWSTGSAAAIGGLTASSPLVATKFFGTWLTALGIGTAVTPIGWVIASAAAAGALGWGATQVWQRYSGSRVEQVPKFINTPLDVLGASLFDLIGGLSVLLARESGALEAAERETILDYFVSDWGLSSDYVHAALPLIEESTQGRSIREAAVALAEFKRENPDCNAEAMGQEILSFLEEIAQADGVYSEEQELAIAQVARIFAAGGFPLLEETGYQAGKSVGKATQKVSETTRAAWDKVSGWVRSAPRADAGSEAPGRDVPLPVPTLWLLGKTGAGKSSLVCALTGEDASRIGNGFEACTRTAEAFVYPAHEPVMRFLDTRGLGEVNYDPAADLAEIGKAAHVVLLLLRLDDPVQGVVADALAKIRKHGRKMPVLVLHTGADLMPDAAARDRARAANHAQMEQAWGGSLPAIDLDLSDPRQADLEALREHLVQVLPSVVLFLSAETASDAESAEFARHRALVLSFAGSATATGALPLVGAASVPALQLAMLSKLADRYGVEWNKRRLGELAAALGAGVLGGQAMAFAAREAAKLVPVVGQTVAPVASATWGFTATYALGRAAAWWFYKMRRGEPVDEAELQARFKDALKGAMKEMRSARGADGQEKQERG